MEVFFTKIVFKITNIVLRAMTNKEFPHGNAFLQFPLEEISTITVFHWFSSSYYDRCPKDSYASSTEENPHRFIPQFSKKNEEFSASSFAVFYSYFSTKFPLWIHLRFVSRIAFKISRDLSRNSNKISSLLRNSIHLTSGS